MNITIKNNKDETYYYVNITGFVAIPHGKIKAKIPVGDEVRFWENINNLDDNFQKNYTMVTFKVKDLDIIENWLFPGTLPDLDLSKDINLSGGVRFEDLIH